MNRDTKIPLENLTGFSKQAYMVTTPYFENNLHLDWYMGTCLPQKNLTRFSHKITFLYSVFILRGCVGHQSWVLQEVSSIFQDYLHRGGWEQICTITPEESCFRASRVAPQNTPFSVTARSLSYLDRIRNIPYYCCNSY